MRSSLATRFTPVRHKSKRLVASERSGVPFGVDRIPRIELSPHQLFPVLGHLSLLSWFCFRSSSLALLTNMKIATAWGLVARRS